MASPASFGSPDTQSAYDVPGRNPNQPRYAWLRECIQRDIESGKYPVGALLPPEHQIAETYGVSRHTVREATRKLAETGLISRHPGIGTIVRSAVAAKPFVAALGTITDLFAYTSTTRLKVLQSRELKADANLAAELGCKTRSRWIGIDAFRYPLGESTPISFTRVYLRSEFAGIRDRLHGNHPSIYSMLEQDYGQTIVAVRQAIEAMLMPADAARLLGVRARSPALHLRRAYYGAADRVLGVSSNLYAAERFRLETSWRLEPDEALHGNLAGPNGQEPQSAPGERLGTSSGYGPSSSSKRSRTA
jgi:DNA-binding GntR family transcriptional regulator